MGEVLVGVTVEALDHAYNVARVKAVLGARLLLSGELLLDLHELDDDFAGLVVVELLLAEANELGFVDRVVVVLVVLDEFLVEELVVEGQANVNEGFTEGGFREGGGVVDFAIALVVQRVVQLGLVVGGLHNDAGCGFVDQRGGDERVAAQEEELSLEGCPDCGKCNLR